MVYKKHLEIETSLFLLCVSYSDLSKSMQNFTAILVQPKGPLADRPAGLSAISFVVNEVKFITQNSW